MQNNYELAIVLHPELSSQERDKFIELIEKMAKQFGGEVTKREEGSKKTLAYPISKQTEGWYFFLHLNLPPESVVKLDTKLKMEEKLLRHLILNKQLNKGNITQTTEKHSNR